MDFSKVKSLTIPEGNVIKIMSGNVVLWTKPKEPAANSVEQRRREGLALIARPFPMFKPIQRFKGILSNPQVRQRDRESLIP